MHKPYLLQELKDIILREFAIFRDKLSIIYREIFSAGARIEVGTSKCSDE